MRSKSARFHFLRQRSLPVLLLWLLASSSSSFLGSDFITWSSPAMGSGGGVTASVVTTVTSGFHSTIQYPATNPDFVSQFAPSYSLLEYRSPSGAGGGDISSVITFSSSLPSGSKVLVVDVDARDETVILMGDGAPPPLLQQLESIAGEVSTFPIYNAATGSLVENGPASPDFNNREVTVFDASGLGGIDVTFLNGGVGSGCFVAVYVASAPQSVPLLTPFMLLLTVFLVGLSGRCLLKGARPT